MKLQESQTLVWPQAEKTLNTKIDKFWYIRYILGLEKDQEMQLSQAEDTILIYTVYKMHP